MGILAQPLKVPRLQGIPPEQIDRGWKMIQDAFRQLAQQNATTNATLAASGLIPNVSAALEAGIMAGSLINVRISGSVLAVNTDVSRFVTDIAVAVSGTQVTSYNVGLWNVLCLPIASTTQPLFLSSTFGYATDVEPTPDPGNNFLQVIGMRKTDRNSGALCSVSFAPQQYISL